MPVMLVVVLLAASAVQAQALDAADVAEGMRLFRQKGNCQACHGWAGDGRKMDDQMPDGANLREIALKRADLKSRELSMPDPPATLQPREIELLADFLFAKVIGKGPMDRAKCVEYWGSEVEVCFQFSANTNR